MGTTAGSPAPAPGVLSAVVDGQFLVFEPLARAVHTLNPTGSVIWDGVLRGLAVDELVDEVRAIEGAPAAAEAEAEVAAFVADLHVRRLLGGRVEHPPEPLRWSQPDELGDPGAPVLVLPVLDELVAVTAEPEIADEVRHELSDRFGSPPPLARPVHRRLHVRPEASGAGTAALEVVGFGSPQRAAHGAVAPALATVCNQVAASNESMLALHAAGLRAPSGEVVVFPGASGAGKSTLAGRLVREGWSYLGDEAIGLRVDGDGRPDAFAYPKPLSLAPASRALLGLDADGPELVAVDVSLGGTTESGDAGPVGAVVLVERLPGVPPAVERMGSVDAATAVAEAAFNLVHAGQGALDTIVAVAEHVPVWRLVHHGDDAPALVDRALRAGL